MPHHGQHPNELFPARLTDKALVGSGDLAGLWTYAFRAEYPDAVTALYGEALSPRVGTLAANFALELSNADVDVTGTPLVWMRQRGLVGGMVVFEFLAPAASGGGGTPAVSAWKEPVRAATAAAGTLATSFENGDAIDGVTLATGDRILIKNQSTASQNGVYVVAASGAPTRATDADSGSELLGAVVCVSEGTANADTIWKQTTNATITVGTTALAWALVVGGDVYGPASATDNAVARFDGATGKLIQDTVAVTISDAGLIDAAAGLVTVSGHITTSVGDIIANNGTIYSGSLITCDGMVETDTNFRAAGLNGIGTTRNFTDAAGNAHAVTVTGGIVTAWVVTPP